MQTSERDTDIVTSPSPTQAQHSPMIKWLWIGLVAIVLFASGIGIGKLLGPGLPGAQSAEVKFARMMVAHHNQAVSMSLNISDRSESEDIRILARDITLTQQAQIGQMQGWLAVWNHPLSGAEAPMAGMEKMMGMASQQEVNALRTLPAQEAEVSFLRLMIRHHQGGIMMAQEVLQTSERAEVLRLATAIINSQQSEISAMQMMLKKRGA